MTDEDWFEREQLHFAARDGNLSRVKRLVESGFDVNAFDDLSMTPMHWAAKGGMLRSSPSSLHVVRMPMPATNHRSGKLPWGR